MTVTYMQHVHTASFGSFIRVLTQWRGSIFKGIGRNLLLYCLLLAVTQVTYRFGLSGDEEVKQAFERLCVVVKEHKDVLPLDFILGFYVTQVHLLGPVSVKHFRLFHQTHLARKLDFP